MQLPELSFGAFIVLFPLPTCLFLPLLSVDIKSG